MTGKGGSSIDSFRWFFVIFPCLKSSLRDERKQSKNNLPKKKHMQLWVLTPILKIDFSHTNCICREIWDFRKLFKCSAEGFFKSYSSFLFLFSWKNAKIQTFKCDILSNFQTVWANIEIASLKCHDRIYFLPLLEQKPNHQNITKIRPSAPLMVMIFWRKWRHVQGVQASFNWVSGSIPTLRKNSSLA